MLNVFCLRPLAIRFSKKLQRTASEFHVFTHLCPSPAPSFCQKYKKHVRWFVLIATTITHNELYSVTVCYFYESGGTIFQECSYYCYRL